MSVADTIFLAARVRPAVKKKLHTLAQAVHKSQGAILSALIIRATVEDLPTSWRESADAERQLLAEVERWQAQ
jgi:predicted transcriptional regulator